MKKTILKSLLIAVLVIPCIAILAACGGGGSIYGTNPQLPSFVEEVSATTTASEFKELLTAYSDVEVDDDVYSVVTGTRMINSIEHTLQATNYGSEAFAEAFYDAFASMGEAWKSVPGLSKSILQEAGWDNLQIGESGLSWEITNAAAAEMPAGKYSVSAKGAWVIIEAPTSYFTE